MKTTQNSHPAVLAAINQSINQSQPPSVQTLGQKPQILRYFSWTCFPPAQFPSGCFILNNPLFSPPVAAVWVFHHPTSLSLIYCHELDVFTPLHTLKCLKTRNHQENHGQIYLHPFESNRRDLIPFLESFSPPLLQQFAQRSGSAPNTNLIQKLNFKFKSILIIYPWGSPGSSQLLPPPVALSSASLPPFLASSSSFVTTGFYY